MKASTETENCYIIDISPQKLQWHILLLWVAPLFCVFFFPEFARATIAVAASVTAWLFINLFGIWLLNALGIER